MAATPPLSLAAISRYLEQIEMLLRGVATFDDRPLPDVVIDLDADTKDVVGGVPQHVSRVCDLVTSLETGDDSVVTELASEAQLAVHGLVMLLTTLQMTQSTS